MVSSITQVVERGICVGCGACAVACSAITMQRNEFGVTFADISNASDRDLEIASKVCPFAHESANEDVIAKKVFFAKDIRHDARVGFFTNLYAGRISDDLEIVKSSSGGLTNWFLQQLFCKNLIDGVIHVGSVHSGGDLFSYQVSESVEQLTGKRKSQYYAVGYNDAVNHVRGNGKRYAFVGVPCFVTSVRLLMDHDSSLSNQIAFCFSLVCGHLKSPAFAEALAWQVGVRPKELAAVDFRVKVEGRPAADYNFAAWNKDGSLPKSAMTKSLVGGNWGHALFQLRSCDFCDDVFGETADISFGDAWLSEFSEDWRGTNVIVSRRICLDEILAEAVLQNKVWVKNISVVDAAKSQEGNYRHRWDGLSQRLADDLREGKWIPKKRIAPNSRNISGSRRRIVRLRRRLGELSHSAFLEAKEAGDFSVFRARVSGIFRAIEREYKMARRLKLSTYINAFLRVVGAKNK